MTKLIETLSLSEFKESGLDRTDYDIFEVEINEVSLDGSRILGIRYRESRIMLSVVASKLETIDAIVDNVRKQVAIKKLDDGVETKGENVFIHLLCYAKED